MCYFVFSALKKSEESVIELEEKRKLAAQEALAIVKAKEEADAKRLEAEELARIDALEKEQMVRPESEEENYSIIYLTIILLSCY